MNMKKSLIALIGLLPVMVPMLASAAGGHGPALDHVRIDVTDQPSLQRGAKLFVNYCMGCHSADYVRYNRTAADIGMTEDQMLDNLVFTGVKVGETMKINMPKDEAKEWFGKTPPDLSVISRSRGADWLYSYLRGFYRDDSRPVGVNNVYFPDVGMPHVLWELQGWQKPVYKEVKHGEKTVQEFDGFEQVAEGALSPKEYDRAMRDLVNFLVYIGEPAQLHRKHYGPYVLGFLVVFTILAFLLKKEYFRDVH